MYLFFLFLGIFKRNLLQLWQNKHNKTNVVKENINNLNVFRTVYIACLFVQHCSFEYTTHSWIQEINIKERYYILWENIFYNLKCPLSHIRWETHLTRCRLMSKHPKIQGFTNVFAHSHLVSGERNCNFV